MELLIREVDEGGGGLTETRASEAKGPFPGGKRVGSRGKKKNVKEKKQKPMDCVPWVSCFCMMRVKKKTPSTSMR